MKRIMMAIMLLCAFAFSSVSVMAETEDGNSEEEQHLLDLLFANIDQSHYEERDGGLYSDNRMEKAVMEAEVEGTTLSLGMAYKEVNSAGFYAPDGFADEETHKGLSTYTTFKTKDEKKVELGFSGLSDKDKVGDGILYSIARPYYWEEDQASITIEGSAVGTDLATVIETFGEPTTMSEKERTPLTVEMRYNYSDDAILESVSIYLDRDGIVKALELQGTLK